MENWKKPGLPHKGWQHSHVTDLEDLMGACEWCSTAIRYEHHLYHPVLDIETTAGCICAEHLTQDYVSAKKAEKELKRKLKLKNKLRIEFYSGFKPSRKNPENRYITLNKINTTVIIFRKKIGYALKINDMFGKRTYYSTEQAKSAAWNYIAKKLL